MKNFKQIVSDIAQMRWSTVVLEDSFAEIEQSIKLAVKQANSYMFGLKDFPFRIKKGGTITQANAFAAPNGKITEMWCPETKTYLRKIDNGDMLDMTKTDKPTAFWVDYDDNGGVVHIFPTPDKPYNLLYRYITNGKARDAEGNEKANLEEPTDVVNIPNNASFEDLYLQCLYTKSMVYWIADDQDENYLPYQKEFDEAYRNLLSAVDGVKESPRIII